MQLSEIIEGVELSSRTGDQDPRIGKITFDSRQVDEGDLFVAVKGLQADGHQFIDRALQSGAAAIVCQEPGHDAFPGVPLLQVSDSRKVLAQMAAAFYGHPSRELSLMGVTGILVNHRPWLRALSVPRRLVPEPYRLHDWNRGTLAQLLFDPDDPRTAYAAGSEGVWKTTDGGRTFRALTAGFPSSPAARRCRTPLP